VDPPGGDWPRPPAAIVAARLDAPPQGARVTVCGLVTVRQRPGSARGVVFVTLEDETGVVNVIVWAKTFARFRREVIAGRLLRVTGRLQREGMVIHVVAERIEDVSHLLDGLARLGARFDNAWARADEVRRPQPEGSRPPQASAAARAQARMAGPLAAAPPRALHPRDQARRLFPSRPLQDG
jgi:DNA polymerase III alpha subunit